VVKVGELSEPKTFVFRLYATNKRNASGNLSP